MRGRVCFGQADVLKLKRVVALLVIAATFALSDALAEEGHGQINVEGGWAYTTRSDHGGSSTSPRPVRPRTISGFSLRAVPTSD
jgi:hypothetical protein